MKRLLIRLALVAFPAEFRARQGRAMSQTLLTDAERPSQRGSTRRLIHGLTDAIRAGLAERARQRRRVAPAESRGPRPGWWPVLRDDLHQVRRGLTKRPAFALTVITTLGLGLAANIVVFALVNGVLLRDLPYRDPSRVAFMWTTLDWIGVPRAWVSGPHIDQLQREAATIDRIVPMRLGRVQVIGTGAPELVQVGLSGGSLFDLLGVQPMLGRTFSPDDELRDVVVLGHSLWRQQFGADPGVVGRSVEVDGTVTEIIGVMPEEFRFRMHTSLGAPERVDAWLPADWELAEWNPNQFSFGALVRVRADSTIAEAQAELDVIGGRLDRESYGARGFGWHLVGLKDDLVAGARPSLLLLGAAAAFLLLIVSTNIASVMLVRHADRQREFALRSALGASRRALMRLVAMEGAVLAACAVGAGLGVAWLATRAIAASGSIPMPRLAEVSMDWRVVLFTVAAATTSGLLFALVPAWRSTRTTNDVLKSGGRSGSARSGTLRHGLVVSEIAIAVVLLSSSVLLFRSYDAVRRADPGFEPSGVLSARLVLDDAREADAVPFFETLATLLAARPGVEFASGTTNAPLSGGADQMPVRPVDGPLLTLGDGPEATITSDVIWSLPHYVDAIGAHLVAGRDFTWSDRAGAALVAVVDETLARTAWPDADPIGRQVTVGGGELTTVVGVIRQPRLYAVEADDRAQIYLPFLQDPGGALTIVLRTDGDPAPLGEVLRQTVRGLDPRQPVADVVLMPDVVGTSLLDRRLQLHILGAFGAAALLLALIGIYSVLSSVVRDRTREIGIRLALGAPVASVSRLVLARTAALVAIGLAIGLLVAVAMARALAHFLFGVEPTDLVSLSTTAGVIVLAAVVASQIPLRRATSIDPIVALQND